VEPIIFTRKAWRVFGFIPDLEINHQQLLLEDIVVQLVKEEHQETTIVAYNKYYIHSPKIKV